MLDSIVDMSLVCKESYQNVYPVSVSVSDLRMCVGHSPSGAIKSPQPGRMDVQ